MPHEISRILGAVCARPWMIDPAKGVEIANLLALRAGGAAPGWDGTPNQASYTSEPVTGRSGPIHVLRVHGTIMPRADMMTMMSGGVSLESFAKAFKTAADDDTAQAIVLEFDTPGGAVDLVPETAAQIHAARREGRPIVASVNTLAASAGYYLAAACDEICVTPSGMVGSIGVYTMHDDLSGALDAAGIDRTVIFEGARKTERHPWGALTEEAKAAIQASVKDTYATFTSDVAKFRGASVATVRADPEKSEDSFGGGRVYHAKEAVRRGMADRVETYDQTLRRVSRGKRTSTRVTRARLNLA